MTKYNSASRRGPEKKKLEGPHPIWRGIGCTFMILVPLISGALAKITIDYGLANNWAIPYQLLGNPTLPKYFYKVPSLIFLFGPFTTWTNFYAYLSIGLIYVLFLGGFLSFGYAMVYRFVGPPRWGPQDAPPPKSSKHRAYKR